MDLITKSIPTEPHDDPEVREEKRLFAINRRGEQRIVIIIIEMKKWKSLFSVSLTE